ncbi:phosphotransferase [Candidatus Woesearchaeota archaeon]|nr:phosphotransferase [Candidatus Woesearchaeota archaeon]
MAQKFLVAVEEDALDRLRTKYPWKPKKQSAEGSKRLVALDLQSLRQYRQTDDILDKLVKAGVREQDAEAIASEFEDLLECRPADIKSKNQVYHLTDCYGRKKVIKFVTSNKEARIESLVNYHFSRHPVLSRYVAGSDFELPEEVRIGSDTKHIVIQEDICEKADQHLDNILKNGTRRQLNEYLEFWMKALAELHVYGTGIMDDIGVRETALRLTKEKDNDRVNTSNRLVRIVGYARLRQDIAEMDLESRDAFIHQDIRAENRIGQYAIDWGHAGRGNPMLDIARVLSDYDVNKRGVLSDDLIKQYIASYLREKKQLLGDTARVSDSELDSEFMEFCGLRLLYFQAQTAYLVSKGDECSDGEVRTKDFMVRQIPAVEKCLRKSRVSLSMPPQSFSVQDRPAYVPAEGLARAA